MNTGDDVGKRNECVSEQKEAGEEVVAEIEKEPEIEKSVEVGKEVATVSPFHRTLPRSPEPKL
nr:hypothetical protein [Tanacetum cinerariifolium]